MQLPKKRFFDLRTVLAIFVVAILVILTFLPEAPTSTMTAVFKRMWGDELYSVLYRIMTVGLALIVTLVLVIDKRTERRLDDHLKKRYDEIKR